MSHLQGKDAQLFVHLAWETRDDTLGLPNDQFRQAAHLAMRVRLRCLCCHLVATGDTPGQISLVARFPASLPISAIARTAYVAATEAAARLHETLHGTRIDPEALWSREYAAQTLSKMDAAQARAYLSGVSGIEGGIEAGKRPVSVERAVHGDFPPAVRHRHRLGH